MKFPFTEDVALHLKNLIKYRICVFQKSAFVLCNITQINGKNMPCPNVFYLIYDLKLLEKNVEQYGET